MRGIATLLLAGILAIFFVAPAHAQATYQCHDYQGNPISDATCNHYNVPKPTPTCGPPTCDVKQEKDWTKWLWYCIKNKPVDQGYVFKGGKYKGLKEVTLSAWRWKTRGADCQTTFGGWNYDRPGDCTKTSVTYYVNASLRLTIYIGNRNDLPQNVRQAFELAEDSASGVVSKELSDAFTTAYQDVKNGKDKNQIEKELEQELAKAFDEARADLENELPSNVKSQYDNEIDSAFNKLKNDFVSNSGNFVDQLDKTGKIDYSKMAKS